jgi:hypothetical protein
LWKGADARMPCARRGDIVRNIASRHREAGKRRGDPSLSETAHCFWIASGFAPRNDEGEALNLEPKEW